MVSRFVTLAALLTLLLVFASSITAQPLTKLPVAVSVANTALTGDTFGYRLHYSCEKTAGPCLNAEVVDLLPAEVQFFSTVPSVALNDLAAINVTPNYMGTGRTQVRFQLISPLSQGSEGTLEIQARFPAGTTPAGTTASNVADGINLQTEPGTYSTLPVTVTAAASLQVTPSMSLQSSPANLDMPEQYRLRVAVADAPGALNVSALGPLTSVLSPGTVFNGSTPAADCQPGCVGTTPATVTWTSPCNVPMAPGTACDVVLNVTFPSATFTSGTSVTSSFVANVTPLGGASQELEQAAITHVVTTFVPTPDVSIETLVAETSANPPTLNQPFSYEINASNSGNVPLDDLVLIDTLPVALTVASVTTGSFNGLNDFSFGTGVRVSYEKNTALGVSTLWGSSPSTTTSTPLTAPPPGLGAGEYMTRIRWEFGQASTGMVATERPKITGVVSPVDATGQTVLVGDAVQNCVSLSAVYTAGPVTVTGNDCAAFNVSGPFVQLSPTKELVSDAGSLVAGQVVEFRMRVLVDPRSSDEVLLEKVMVADLLPVGLSFGESEEFDDQGTGLPAPLPVNVTSDFGGTGRTLLRWKWSAGSGSLAPGEQVWLIVPLVVGQDALPSELVNEFALMQKSGGLETRCTGIEATDDLDFDGRRQHLGDHVCGGEVGCGRGHYSAPHHGSGYCRRHRLCIR